MQETILNNNQTSDEETQTLFTLTQEQLDKIRAEHKAKNVKHKWRQSGVWVYCSSCDNEHGFFVGVNKKLVGIDDDGNPVIVDF